MVSHAHEIVSGVFLNENERSYVIRLISEINEYVRGRDLRIKRAGGENTINGVGFVKFPDILLFSDRSQSLILQGWEAKCPDVPIDDAAFVEDARSKARLLGCNSTVLWNFHRAQLHVCNDDGDFEILEDWTIDPRITDRQSVELYEAEWKRSLHLIIDKVGEYISTGAIRHRTLAATLTESVMPGLINENKGILSDALKYSAARDVMVGTYVENWWEAAHHEYMNDETDPYRAYAKILLTSWLNRLLFANLIQNGFEVARRIGDIVQGCKVNEAEEVFGDIMEGCGFHNIFDPLPYSDHLPEETWVDLVNFNELLLECSIDRLEGSYAHRLLEESVSVSKRQLAGQYPTPEPLAALMSEIAIRNAYGEAWDCCCGTGTIGCALWRRKLHLLEEVEPEAVRISYDTTWASDVHDFPLQIAAEGFASLAPSSALIRVMRRNVFDAAPGTEAVFTDPASGHAVTLQIPKYDSIASNLPFVDFNTDGTPSNEVAMRHIATRFQNELRIELSDRNDLYCYIALHLDNLLSEDGCMCLLTSNSWLCTSAGEGFMRALQATYDIDGIYVNGMHRWFRNADVMNAMLVLKKKRSESIDACYMGAINASIDDLANECTRGSISRRIISHTSACPHVEEKLLSYEQIDELKSMGLSYYTICRNATFMLDVAEKLCPIASLFDVRRGTKSGMDSFFYSKDRNFVEEELRIDLLKSFDETTTYELQPSWYAFCCDKPVEYLEEQGFNKAVARIRSVSTPNKSCRSHRPYWYTLPDSAPPLFATPMNPGGRLFFAVAPEGRRFIANQRVICLYPTHSNLDKELCLALLNSALGMLLIEASAAPMALGALDTRAQAFKTMYMLDPLHLSSEKRDAIVSAFKPLKERCILDALEELEQADRKTFDEVVFQSFGIEEHTEAIRDALREMLLTRLG